MKLHHHDRCGRTAFTLIEMLVVVAIVALLIGMTTVAVLRILGSGDELKARNDISQLAAAVTRFKEEFKVDHVPSRIILYEQGGWGSSQLDIDSRAYLKNMFPGINLDTFPQPNLAFHDWNGNGVPDGPHVLEGHYSLIFFLGGIPDPANNATQLFATDNRNPTNPGGARRGREFNFKQNKLVRGYNGFFYYIDPWDSPYAFFSAYRKSNGYNRYPLPPPGQTLVSDCASLGLSPYIHTAQLIPNTNPAQYINKYYNPESFQIISAGKDRTFGPGGGWGPAFPGTAGTDDNMSNFHNGVMKSE